MGNYGTHRRTLGAVRGNIQENQNFSELATGSIFMWLWRSIPKVKDVLLNYLWSNVPKITHLLNPSLAGFISKLIVFGRQELYED